jgi:NAD(P)-dependent dehydrogenase (short-subunit alcohol dehydrogenase family)
MWSAPKGFERPFPAFTPPALALAKSLAALGIFSVEGLRATSEIWNALEFKDTQGFDDTRRLSEQLVRRLIDEKLPTEAAENLDVSRLYDSWQMPVIPIMEKQGGGSIVNISSVAGIRYTGVPYSTYYATKAAMIHLTRTTAVQYASKHIRVNAALPGLMKTPMVEKTAGLAAEYGKGDIEEMWKVCDAQCPMGHGRCLGRSLCLPVSSFGRVEIRHRPPTGC